MIFPDSGALPNLAVAAQAAANKIFIVLQGFYRRQLPHLQRDNKPHFLTFCTEHRWILPKQIRSIVLDCCLHDDAVKIDIQAAIVMPTHVHMIFTPLVNQEALEVCSLAEIMNAIKGASAHKINQALGRKGRVWQAESFDHLLRSSEGLQDKVRYILENPMRQGLVGRWEDYRGCGTNHSRIPMLRLKPRGDSRPRLSGRVKLAGFRSAPHSHS